MRFVADTKTVQEATFSPNPAFIFGEIKSSVSEHTWLLGGWEVGGFELTRHSVDGSQRPQHADRPDGGEADVLQVEGVLQHPAATEREEGQV